MSQIGPSGETRGLILVVEDDDVSGGIFRQILEQQGYGVHLVTDGEAALAHVEHEVPYGMVLDLHLATTDAPDLLRRVRAIARLASIPAVVVTGDYLVDDAVVHDLESLGARVYFKPLWNDDLLAIVKAFGSG